MKADATADLTADWWSPVLDFWFGELTPEDWFKSTPETDAACRRFGPLNTRLAEGVPPAALQQPDAALAAIIVLDQIPRNIHRGRAEAFATDDKALAVARNAVDRGLDAAVAPERRAFVYMPFMHAERLAEQERCVALFTALGNETNLKFAVEHRDIIARFGRFPHRNRVLGRTSTAEEEAFLAAHAGYGQ
ncbi:DUF924 domain-containing protein [Aquibium sp. A9E412]|uniref:DUF924 family protein n=1 Tax=Aquibium sp. A9E412 TaxID=2976767 RepID=UPI0025AFF516|nr:DUF924 family protein [Aquibium sp. A9E412]MDN2568546.1 DUF924 domain-containing protein [Aquibium sp. A9E412]